MDEKFQKIYVGTNEGITSVVDCLVSSLEKDILLIIPPENKNFQNLITLKLLKREAKTLGKNIILISSNQTLKKLAPKIGLRIIDYFQLEEVSPEVFYDKSSELGRVSDILPPQKSSRMPSFPKEEFLKPKEEKSKFLEKLLVKEKIHPEILEEEEQEEVSGEKEELAEKRAKKKIFSFLASKLFIYILILICLGVVGFAFFSLPKAKVEVTPKTDAISFDLAIKLDKGISEVDFSQKKIPAQLIQIEKTAANSFLTSGKKLKESKARGTIRVFNNYNSSPQSLVATTRFISENGKLFRTTSSITIPGAQIFGGKMTPSSYDIEVVAAEPGEDYNIEPSTFSIPGFAGTPKYTGFYGKSTTPMSGGFRGEVRFVTNEDIKEARKKLEQQLSGIEGEILGKIPQNLKIIDGASDLKFEEISPPKAGDEKEKFDMSIKGIASALVFNEDDVKKLIEENISTKIVTDKESLPKTQKIDYSIKSISLKEGKADLSIKAEESVTWKIDTANLEKNLVSKTIPEAKEYLSSLVSIQNAKVTLWPFWIKKFPSNSKKIKVEAVL